MQTDTGQDDAGRGSASAKPPPIPKQTVEELPWYENLLANLGERLLGLPIRRLDTLTAVLLIVVADGCSWEAPGGTGAACIILATTAVLYLLAGRIPTGSAVCLSASVMLTAGMMVWHSWWLLDAIAWASLVVLAVKLQRSDWRLLENIWAAGWTLALAPLKALGHLVGGAMRGAAERETPVAGRSRLPVRAVLIPLGVCVTFILIFSAANPVVARLSEDLRRGVRDFFRYFFEVFTFVRMLAWLLWLMFFAALMRPVGKSVFADLLTKFDEALIRPAEEVDEGNYVTALTTLVSVNVLFLIYNVIDANYLYFKAVLPKGITWADYTHAGCGWLTFGLFVSTVVIGIAFWRRLNFHPCAARLKVLCYIWAAQNGVLAMGAIRRLQMYIDFSGLTHLRITGIYGSLLVASGLAIMVEKVRRNRSLIWLLRNYVLAFSMALVVLALTPGNWLCASYNVRKALEGKPRALRPICLKKLAPGALPPLIPLLDYHAQDGDPAKERLVHEGIAAILGRHLDRLEKQESESWRSWQISSAWALKRLRAVRSDINAVVPAAHRHEAERRLRSNYDLAERILPASWSLGARRSRREYR